MIWNNCLHQIIRAEWKSNLDELLHNLSHYCWPSDLFLNRFARINLLLGACSHQLKHVNWEWPTFCEVIFEGHVLEMFWSQDCFQFSVNLKIMLLFLDQSGWCENVQFLLAIWKIDYSDKVCFKRAYFIAS